MTLITDIGETTINYVVGMPQGQVLSVVNSNLLCNAKLGQWTAKDDTCKIENDKGYSFASKDAEDELHVRNAILHKKSYSDDSTLIIHDSNQPDDKGTNYTELWGTQHNLPKGGMPPTTHHHHQISRGRGEETRTNFGGL